MTDDDRDDVLAAFQPKIAGAVDNPKRSTSGRRRRREPWPVVRCTCTRQHSCPMHSRVPTPYELSKAGPVRRPERGGPPLSARLR